jgi:uncharacterized RDD family membrane protein YckC
VAACRQLVTGEAVALDLRPAALPSRVVAGVVDALGQASVLFVFVCCHGRVLLDLRRRRAGLGIVLLVLVLIVYPVTFETLLRGRTPGKAAMGLRVVRDDGGPIGFRQALVRGLAGAFLERPGVTLFVAGVITSLLNPQGKRLGDLLAGTVVVQERVAVRGGSVAVMPPALAGWAAQLDLSGLGNDLALSVRQFVARADDLTPAAREELGRRLVGAVTDVVGPAPVGAPGWAVLSAVLAERRRREEQRLGARPALGSPTPPPPPPVSYAPRAAAVPPPPDPRRPHLLRGPEASSPPSDDADLRPVGRCSACRGTSRRRSSLGGAAAVAGEDEGAEQEDPTRPHRRSPRRRQLRGCRLRSRRGRCTLQRRQHDARLPRRQGQHLVADPQPDRPVRVGHDRQRLVPRQPRLLQPHRGRRQTARRQAELVAAARGRRPAVQAAQRPRARRRRCPGR